MAPNTALNVCEPEPNSGVLLFPQVIAPAALMRVTIKASFVGTVSMDNVALDLGAGGGGVRQGDEALLIAEGLPAEEMARRLGTINYEVTCALTARVPREHHRDGVAP